MYASMTNQVPIVELLLKQKASPTVQDAVGQTPLHMAAANVSLFIPFEIIYSHCLRILLKV